MVNNRSSVSNGVNSLVRWYLSSDCEMQKSGLIDFQIINSFVRDRRRSVPIAILSQSAFHPGLTYTPERVAQSGQNVEDPRPPEIG